MFLRAAASKLTSRGDLLKFGNLALKMQPIVSVVTSAAAAATTADEFVTAKVDFPTNDISH